ncbi:MAG: NAD(+)/NADH kinase [Acidobacteriota bacterium]
MSTKLRNAAVVAKPHIREVGSVVLSLVDWLRQHRIEPVVEERVAEDVRGTCATFPLARPPRDADLLIVLGGDGTLLSAARAMGARQIPILGINLGSLGFLTDIALPELHPALDSILAGEFTIDSRMMLNAELVRKGKVLARQTVLNDVVITKGAIARMIEVGVEINQQFVAMVRADGIIVSTPTGSTAYNLAAGGPILFPGIGSMILTPICPHTLTYRPVVVSARSRIALNLRSDSGEVYLTFDGQVSAPMLQGDLVRVRKSRSSLKLVSLPGRNYFQVLRHKLRWAERPRSRRRSSRS